MSYLIAWFVFEVFYTLYYLGLFMVYFGLIEHYHIDVPLIINAPVAILCLACIPLLFYRAKLAASSYSTNKVSFFEAHDISGAVLKSNLSFLPIIGPLFRSNEEDSSRNRDFKD